MKFRKFAGLLTAAALMLTSQPSMTANAVKDRLETGTKDGYNWELWLQENQGFAKGEQGENGTFSCEWNSSLGFLYCSDHTFEDCVDWRNTEAHHSGLQGFGIQAGRQCCLYRSARLDEE
ncbi:MAG: hypothetical protein IKG82_07570 [Oscillospiraceae bacterium]|nr:hypothetical protein [Oscillospiraceae bacterium]